MEYAADLLVSSCCFDTVLDHVAGIPILYKKQLEAFASIVLVIRSVLFKSNVWFYFLFLCKLIFIIMKFHYNACSIVSALIFAAFSRGLDLQSRQEAPATPASPQSRYVYVVADVDFNQKAVSSRTGKPIFGGHAQIRIDGTSADGPLLIDVAVNAKSTGLQLRVLDTGVANTGKPIGFWSAPNSRRFVVQNGQTTLTNTEIFDHQTGNGLVADAWNDNPTYTKGAGTTPNTCYDMADRILAHMNEDLDPSMVKIFANADEYYTTYSSKWVEKVWQVWSQKTDFPAGYTPSEGEQYWTRVFDVVSKPGAPAFIADNTAMGACTKAKMSRRTCFPTTAFSDDAWYSDSVTQAEFNSIGTEPLPSDKQLPTPEEESRAAVAPFQDSVGKPGTPTNGLATVGMGRAAGVISAVTVVAREVAQAAGLAVGPAFVLLDLVQGNWIGAGLAAVGLALGVAASLTLAGPVGWIVGGLISALFAILPGLFKSKPHLPAVADNVGILQYAFFGDATHTGNEQCQSQGNPNCTAVFGPGVLSLVFKWDNFDSTAFLIQYNEGYAMTLPEIANAFYDINDPKNSGDGSNQIATINCNNKKGMQNRWGQSLGDDMSKCNHPSFQLNRPLITLPVIGQTADKVYSRIIPAPGGDCKLVSDAANSLNIPDYNMTITGQPVAIACGLSAALEIGGTVIPLNPSNNNLTIASVSSGTNSTDGQNGHQLAAPAPIPFQSLLNATTAVCLSGPGGGLCVPSGQYDIQRGSLGFDSSKVDTLNMPAGASIRWYDTQAAMPHAGPTQSLVSYTTNQTSADTHFAAAMASAPTSGPNGAGSSWNATLPAGMPDQPVICLFTETDHNGDVACFGPGGGNVTGGISRKASSIAVHGNATAEVYAQAYGDAGSATITSDVLDLTLEPYGTDDNFYQKIVAMWVCDGSCSIPTKRR